MPTPDDYNNSQPGYRNFTPPPGTPGYFTVANPTGGRPDPTRTTESSTRNGDPRATQTATVPPPPGVPVGTTYPPPPDRPIPPTPDAYKPRAPYTPVPWHQQQPPPADPVPPLADWKHDDQIPDWLAPHIRPAVLRGPLPNRPPDQYWRGSPVWNTRPGEVGYGAGGSSNILSGIVAKLESGSGLYADMQPASMVNKTYGQYRGFVSAYGEGPAGITNYARQMLAANPNATLGDFEAGYVMGTGNPAHPPSLDFMRAQYPAAYNNLLKNAGYPLDTPLSSLVGGAVAGPPQQYIPAQPREPPQWGEPPETDWRPGRMPQSHDIPNILGGLLPLILAGALGGGGMGMLAAFSGYQNARNKGQTEAARDAKNYWKDALEENTSRLKLQMIGAKGILAEYGGLDSPQAKEALLDLALKTDDHQLATAIQGGDMKKVGDLLNTRDKIFQDLSKTKDSQDRADRQEADKEQLNKDVNAGLGVQTPPVREPGGGAEPTQQPFFPGSAGGAPAPAVAPAPSGSGGGGPAAGVPTPSEDGTPRPAAAPPSSAESPSPEEPPPQASAAAPPAGGEPQATLPDVAVSAPQNDPLSRLTPQEQNIARDVLAGGEMPKFPPQAAASETRIEAAVAGLNQQLQRVGDNPNLKDERSVIGAVRGVDPLTADNLAAIAHNQLPLPGSETGTSGSGGSRGVLGYRNLMSTLARKVNPQWDPGQWGGIEKFRDPQGQTQRAIGRITAIGDAGTKLQEDLKRIPDNPTQLQRQLDQFVKQGFTDDPAYSNLFTDWQTFIIDSNALTQGGQGLEGETEQMIKSIPMYGQKSAYEGALKRHASFALSRYQQYQNQWSQLQRQDPMFGHNDTAEKQITNLANIKEGAVGGTPRVGPGGEGYDLVPKGGQYIGPDGKTYTKG